MSLRLMTTGRQGILPFVFELSDRDDVTATAGLPLVVETMRALGVNESAAAAFPATKRAGSFLVEEKLESLVTLIAAGGDRIEDVRILAQDKGLERLLGSAFPSPDALLDFLGNFHNPALLTERPEGKAAFVPAESEGLRALEVVNRDLVKAAADRGATTATVDHDGTIIESHWDGTKTAYEGTRGYQPLVAVWSEEALVLADEFRDGNVAGGEDPLSSAKRAFANLPPWVTTRRYRADSASYYTPLLKYLEDERIEFGISADMTKDLRAKCQAIADSQWTLLEKRAREDVHVAEVSFTPGHWPKGSDPLRYVTIRFSPTQRDLFEDRGPKYLAVVSNRRTARTLPVCAPQAPSLRDLHRAGTPGRPPEPADGACLAQRPAHARDRRGPQAPTGPRTGGRRVTPVPPPHSRAAGRRRGAADTPADAPAFFQAPSRPPRRFRAELWCHAAA